MATDIFQTVFESADILSLTFEGKEETGKAISPETASVATWLRIVQDVAEFISAGEHRSLLKDTVVKVKEGSLALDVDIGSAQSKTLAHDLELLGNARSESLDGIHPVRAGVLERWQRGAKGGNPIHVSLTSKLFMRGRKITITSKTSWRVKTPPLWVETEMTLSGKLVAAGGRKPNIHLTVPGGKDVVLNATEEQIRSINGSDFYREVLADVTGQENLETGELRNLRIKNLRQARWEVSEEEWERFTDAGKKAWGDIKDPDRWLQELRGNHA